MAEYSEANKTLTDIVNGVNSALERRVKIDEVEILKNAGAVDAGAGVYGKFTIEYTSLKKNLDAQFDWIEERRPGKRRFDIGVNTMISGIIGYFISVGNSIDPAAAYTIAYGAVGLGAAVISSPRRLKQLGTSQMLGGFIGGFFGSVYLGPEGGFAGAAGGSAALYGLSLFGKLPELDYDQSIAKANYDSRVAKIF